MKPLNALVAALAGFGGLFVAQGVAAQDDSGIFGLSSASVTYGPYVRFEAGRNFSEFSDGFWRPPGYPNDPEISFSLGDDQASFGSFALGYDWQNGWRADVGLISTGSMNATGSCSSASDGSACDDPVSGHADISNAPLRTNAVMANVFYAPFEARGSNSVFQPFLVAGLGVARNKLGDWTRENTSTGAGRQYRTFEGDTTSGLAWSVGVGASLQVTKPGKWPVIIEAAYKFYDFGEAKGGSIPFPGQGSGTPVEPLTFDHTSHVVTFGVRIPLQRY